MKDYIKEMAITYSDSRSPCIKQSVYAMIEIGDMQVFGSNKMLNDEITICPRDTYGYKSGEGYHLCKDICKQESHADVDAIIAAQTMRINLIGATLTLVGHTYCCDNCKSAMESAGITTVNIL